MHIQTTQKFFSVAIVLLFCLSTSVIGFAEEIKPDKPEVTVIPESAKSEWGNVEVDLNQSVPEYRVIIQGSDNGYLLTDKISVRATETVSVNAYPNENYELNSVLIDGIDKGKITQFNMPAKSVTLRGQFVSSRFTGCRSSFYAEYVDAGSNIGWHFTKDNCKSTDRLLVNPLLFKDSSLTVKFTATAKTNISVPEFRCGVRIDVAGYTALGSEMGKSKVFYLSTGSVDTGVSLRDGECKQYTVVLNKDPRGAIGNGLVEMRVMLSVNCNMYGNDLKKLDKNLAGGKNLYYEMYITDVTVNGQTPLGVTNPYM